MQVQFSVEPNRNLLSGGFRVIGWVCVWDEKSCLEDGLNELVHIYPVALMDGSAVIGEQDDYVEIEQLPIEAAKHLEEAQEMLQKLLEKEKAALEAAKARRAKWEH